jgi:hypothetical protein
MSLQGKLIGPDIPGVLDLLVRVNKAIAAANDDTLPKIMDKYGQ